MLFEEHTDADSEQVSISLKGMVGRDSGVGGFGEQGTEVKQGIFQKAHMEEAAAPHVGNHGSREKDCCRSERN